MYGWKEEEILLLPLFIYLFIFVLLESSVLFPGSQACATYEDRGYVQPMRTEGMLALSRLHDVFSKNLFLST